MSSRKALGLAAASLALLLSACATPTPKPGEVWDAAARRPLSREAAIARLAAADYVLLGEKHDNAEHHRLQAELVAALIAQGRRPALVLEMLSADQAAALAQHLTAYPRDAAGLGAAVGWDRGWSDWSVYRPIAAATLEAGLPVLAGNLGRAATRGVAREGYDALPAGSMLRLASERPLPGTQEQALLDDLEASHCGKVPRERLAPMLRVQRARDASLAAVMASQPQSVLIAGGQHARIDRGVPWVLRQLAPGKSVMALGFVELTDDAPPPTDLPWDLVWFTSATPRGDPCAAFGSRPAAG